MLNDAPAPSGISVVEKADPDWLKFAGVTRRTPPVQAALPLICKVVQFVKSVKLKTVADWTGAPHSTNKANANPRSNRITILPPSKNGKCG